MLKLDFHIHTKSTIKDSEFVFDLQTLNKYINTKGLDCIAITNHNHFDTEQFDIISKSVNAKVFPGMEIDIENSHILIIGDVNKKDELSDISDKLKNKIVDVNSFISFEEFKDIIPNYKDYILIPHYMKKPKITQATLRKFSNIIKCGEVPNSKKFLITIKDKDKLIPVVFSDYRPFENSPFPNKYTYIDCDNDGFSNIKCAIEDRNKVSISMFKRTDEIEYLPDGSTISSKLNIILGTRTSGKTYNIEKIKDVFDFENCLYVPQFSLTGKAEEEKFNDLIKNECDNISDNFYNSFKPLTNKILSFDIISQEKNIESQFDSLIEYAKNADIDSYSKTKIFSELEFYITPDNSGKIIIESLKKIFINEWNADLIEEYFPKEKLKELILILIDRYKKTKQEIMLKRKSNELIKVIKKNLTKESSANAPETIDFITVFKNRKIIEKINKLFEKLKLERKIMINNLPLFNVTVKSIGYNNSTEIRENLKSKNSFKSIYDSYYKKGDLYGYIWALKNDNISLNQMNKALLNIIYEVKNELGESPSGGEKAEFNLLKEIDNANRYDVLLIDEPEASFDNPFIQENIVELIKEISMKTTVCISTHNSTLAMMLNPNKIIFTENNKGNHKIYYGTMGDKVFKTTNGEEIISYDKILNVLEAGKQVYEEKGRKYESFKN